MRVTRVPARQPSDHVGGSVVTRFAEVMLVTSIADSRDTANQEPESEGELDPAIPTLVRAV